MLLFDVVAPDKLKIPFVDVDEGVLSLISALSKFVLN